MLCEWPCVPNGPKPSEEPTSDEVHLDLVRPRSALERNKLIEPPSKSSIDAPQPLTNSPPKPLIQSAYSTPLATKVAVHSPDKSQLWNRRLDSRFELIPFAPFGMNAAQLAPAATTNQPQDTQAKPAATQPQVAQAKATATQPSSAQPTTASKRPPTKPSVQPAARSSAQASPVRTDDPAEMQRIGKMSEEDRMEAMLAEAEEKCSPGFLDRMERIQNDDEFFDLAEMHLPDFRIISKLSRKYDVDDIFGFPM